MKARICSSVGEIEVISGATLEEVFDGAALSAKRRSESGVCSLIAVDVEFVIPSNPTLETRWELTTVWEVDA